jgi:hypothetical protein
MQIIWHAALSNSHHAMRCCHHSVSIARSRLLVRKWKSTWRNDSLRQNRAVMECKHHLLRVWWL